MMKTSILLLLTFLFSLVLTAQQKDFTLNWVNSQNISVHEETRYAVPAFNPEYFNYNPDSRRLTFRAQWTSNGQDVIKASLKNVSYQTIAKTYLTHIDLKQLPNKPKFSLTTAKARNSSFLTFSLSPIINDHGVYKKITHFSIAYTLGRAQRSTSYSTNAVPGNSVLAQGDFFKFYIPKTGVYKISKNFLSSLGMDVNSIDPHKLKIYGDGGAMKPLKNENNLYYDPAETAIQVVGEADGSFDSQDYILFYAIADKGNWDEDNKTNLNLFDDYTYYYITADGGNGQRISNYTPPQGTASTTITTFDDYAYYEVDQYNIGKVGRRWLGDLFDIQNQRSYDFSFPNRVPNSPVTLSIYAASTSETATSMTVKVNDQNLGQLNFMGVTSEVFARDDQFNGTTSGSSDKVTIDLTYNNNGNPAGVAYLDYINVWAKRQLIAGQNQFIFSNKSTATLTGIGSYQLSNTQNISQIWDITDPTNSKSIINNTDQSNSLSFKASLGSLKKYIAIAPTDYYTPMKGNTTQVDNVNLKGSVFRGTNGQFQDVDYLIITTEALSGQAIRLAQHHKQHDDLRIKVVLLKDIYSEFNTGQADISAIRNFIKYVYDNASSASQRVKYVLLFGDASIDYKNRLPSNNNIVPTYESLYSYSLGSRSTASDDFFGMMDPDEGLLYSSDKLDIAVGRILADDPSTAKTQIDKIIAYDSQAAYGPWRNNFVLISDDADVYGSAGSGLEFNLDALGDEITDNKPFINITKIHSDAYEQVNTSGGQRYPDANKAINESVELGATVINYFGHGGENGLASEYIITREDIKNWNNENRYNVFVTVTCEFTRFDNPLRISPGELALHNDKGGSVALVTTTRAIPVSTGTNFNNQLAPFLFNYNGGTAYSVAEAVRLAKNNISAGSRHVVSFFGDPAMKLAFPDPEIELTQINGQPIAQANDTLKALSKVKLSGQVVTPSGSLISNYNGSLTATVYDKAVDRSTLGNDGTTNGNGELVVMDFKTLGNVIFRGQASVKNGKFDFEFIVPKDIKIPVDNGRVSFYSKRNGMLKDNKGYSEAILVGDLNESAPEDNQGPLIKLYMNDENFVSGGITNATPFILAKLEDENGINTASGIGHDLVAYIDGNEVDPIILNDYYKAAEDDYTKGSINYKLSKLENGPHTLTVKAWDVYNNSSTAEIQFVVSGDQKLKLTHVLNYPNPFHNYTEFWFNHNRPYEPLEVQVQVFTVSGKLVWTKNQVVNTEGFLSREISWNGKDQYGQAIGKGVYIYKLTVKSTLTNQKATKYEKLVIL